MFAGAVTKLADLGAVKGRFLAENPPDIRLSSTLAGSKRPDAVTWAGLVWNLFWVTLGNTIAGSVVVGGACWRAAKPATVTACAAQLLPAE